ncbi:hypothetical protein GUF81_02450, partial [Xanthomonas citri pv. citri]|nr:hypothetical protein [Xanthomonas citri pv. citri]
LNQEIKELNKTVSKLNDQIGDLTKKLVDFDNNVNDAYRLIYNLEDEIIQTLQSRGYIDQKEKLSSIFSSRIETDNISNLMKYYNSLNLYKST